jgi:hypothetical protein
MPQLFKRMLADRRVLPHVGNPQEEEYEHPPLARPVLQSLLADFQKNGVPPPPKGDRQQFFLFLSQMSFAFLMLHELTHIRNGHVDFLEARRLPFLQELGGTPLARDEAPLYQALEVDADIGACGFAFDLVSDMKRSDETAVCPPLQTYESRLSVLSMAIFSFFRGFTDKPLDGADLLGNAHPPDRFRYAAFMGAIPSGIKNRPEITLEQAHRAVGRGLRLTEEAFHVLTGEPIPDPTKPDQFLYSEALGPVGTQHRELLKKRWEGGLRAELEKYAYGSPMMYED